jgi:hypothetical protein
MPFLRRFFGDNIFKIITWVPDNMYVHLQRDRFQRKSDEVVRRHGMEKHLSR